MNDSKPGKELKQRSQTALLTSLYVICLAIGALSLYAGYKVIGVGLILAGLILRLEREIKRLRPHSTSSPFKGTGADPIRNDEPTFNLDLANPWLKDSAGWDSVELYPARKTYQREYCFGGPPTCREVWEYEVKSDECVLGRLRDQSYDDIYENHRYEIANGCIQTSLIQRKNREHEERDHSRPESERRRYPPPYSDATLSEMHREIEWHELEGIYRYFILANDGFSTKWKREVEKLRDSFSKIEAVAEALGATLDEYGNYVLPEDANDERRSKLNELFSEKMLLRTYGVPSFRVWAERDQIVALLRPSSND